MVEVAATAATQTAEVIAEVTTGVVEVEVGAILRAGAVNPLHTARAGGTKAETTVRTVQYPVHT